MLGLIVCGLGVLVSHARQASWGRLRAVRGGPRLTTVDSLGSPLGRVGMLSDVRRRHRQRLNRRGLRRTTHREHDDPMTSWLRARSARVLVLLLWAVSLAASLIGIALTRALFESHPSTSFMSHLPMTAGGTFFLAVVGARGMRRQWQEGRWVEPQQRSTQPPGQQPTVASRS